MLTVIPIQDKNVQKELCELCKIEFGQGSFAYRADDGVFLGVCQFEFVGECGVINGLKYAPDTSDSEAMIIMLRAAMNFMYRCGLKTSCFSSADAVCAPLIPLSAYIKNENGIYTVDLVRFYNSGCHH